MGPARQSEVRADQVPSATSLNDRSWSPTDLSQRPVSMNERQQRTWTVRPSEVVFSGLTSTHEGPLSGRKQSPLCPMAGRRERQFTDLQRSIKVCEGLVLDRTETFSVRNERVRVRAGDTVFSLLNHGQASAICHFGCCRGCDPAGARSEREKKHEFGNKKRTCLVSPWRDSLVHTGRTPKAMRESGAAFRIRGLARHIVSFEGESNESLQVGHYHRFVVVRDCGLCRFRLRHSRDGA